MVQMWGSTATLAAVTVVAVMVKDGFAGQRRELEYTLGLQQLRIFISSM